LRVAEWIVARARGGDHAATAFGRAAAVAIGRETLVETIAGSGQRGQRLAAHV